MTLATTPLAPVFGLEVHGLDLNEVTANHLYPEIRAAFETNSALLFRNQDLSDSAHLGFSRLFGPLENRDAEDLKEDQDFAVPRVSNVKSDGSVTGAMDFHTLNLKANMLWHVDSAFLPIPALVNILIGRVVTDEGGETELASTRAAWAAMPEELKARVHGRGIRHHLAQSRRRISEKLAEDPMFHKWPAQHWNALWRNPVTGDEALYIASHAFAVDGLDSSESAALIDDLIAFCTRPEFTYSHRWRVGDVLLWDQRAVLHRGRPWDYSQPRTLTSLCVSATIADGLDTMRVPA